MHKVWGCAALVFVTGGCSSKELTETTPSGETAPSCATELLFVDADNDGVGDSSQPEEACVNTVGHSPVGGDCDDSDPSVNPNANEVCNGIDDDCDGSIDRGLLVDVWSDLDGDGFGDPDTFERVCTAEAHHVRDDSDCDDTDAEVNPEGVEVCDGVDQDCDGDVDEDATDRVEVFADLDGDGLGDPTEVLLACPEEPGTVDNAWDCDDTDPATPVVVDAGEAGEGTLESPLGTIQAGVDLAHASEGEACVVVLGGLYSERIDLSAGEVSVVGVMGPSSTVVDGYGLDGPVLTLGAENQAATVVEGLTLTQGTPQRTVSEFSVLGSRFDVVRDAGAGVYASGARATLRDLHITDNRILDPELTDYEEPGGVPVQVTWEGTGGGIYNEGGTLVVESCRLVGNEAQVGGGIYAEQALVVSQTEFLQNLATDLGGGLATRNATVTVENSVFAGNQSDTAPTLYAADSAVLLSQITVKDDVVDDAFGALIGVRGVLGLWTNLLLSAATGDGVHVEDANTSVSLEGVLVDLPGALKDAPTGTLRVVGELVDTPIFVDFIDNGIATDDDLHLDADSPGVDAGLSGRDPDGSPADLGAYGGTLGDW